MKISVIIPTYNRVDALDIVLQSLETQTQNNFEIIIADDGSKKNTAEFIDAFKKKSIHSIKHVWQEDTGFRLARIRNLAIKEAIGDYLIFLDGDCAVQPDFIEKHEKLSEPYFMVTGSRILLEQKITTELCQSRKWSFEKFKTQSLKLFTEQQINKFLPLFIKLPDHRFRKYSKFVWKRIKGCNMACWKADAIAIDGFDEALVGWGHEDADFVFRLYSHGIQRKSGSWATEVLHLWHKMADKESAQKNAEIVRAKILAKMTQ